MERVGYDTKRGGRDCKETESLGPTQSRAHDNSMPQHVNLVDV